MGKEHASIRKMDFVVTMWSSSEECYNDCFLKLGIVLKFHQNKVVLWHNTLTTLMKQCIRENVFKKQKQKKKNACTHIHPLARSYPKETTLKVVRAKIMYHVYVLSNGIYYNKCTCPNFHCSINPQIMSFCHFHN